ncbi:hypothetical protein EDD16DRAFT_1529492, partial [Pisolithus croceorrhizus]
RQKQAELKSVLDPQTKKRGEILIQRVKKPRNRRKLPGKYNSLIKICAQKSSSANSSQLLPTPEQGTRKVAEACDDLMRAKHFKEVLNVCLMLGTPHPWLTYCQLILMIGNYMNGTGIKGGAFGFKVSSINKARKTFDPLDYWLSDKQLVDTKSVNNTTLLHFLERTIHKHFPHMDEFLDELSKPSEAYRVNMQDVRKDLELNDYYGDIDQNDGFSRQMWQFIGRASSKLEDLTDDVTHTETSLAEVIRYYGEDEKNTSSTEFFAVFKTFVTSFKKCRTDNRSAVEEKQATERRKQAMAESRIQRQNGQRSVADEEDDGVLDNLLDKLRNGDSIVRRDRKNRKPDARLALPLLDTVTVSDKAKGMLAQLKADGFDASLPPSPNFTAPRRRVRKRVPETLSEAGESRTDLTLAVDARTILSTFLPAAGLALILTDVSQIIGDVVTCNLMRTDTTNGWVGIAPPVREADDVSASTCNVNLQMDDFGGDEKPVPKTAKLRMK